MREKSLRDSTAASAIAFYLKQTIQPEEWVEWMVLFFPFEAAFISPLRPHQPIDFFVPRHGTGEPRFGLYNQSMGNCLAVGASETDLIRVAYTLGRQPFLAH